MIDRQLGHPGARDRVHHLRAVLGDATGLVLATHHEPGDVLQEDQRDLALVAQFDEVRALQRRLREQDAVVRDDPDRVSPEMGEPGHERRAVLGLELVEEARVHETRDHFAHVVGRARVGRHDAVEVARDRRTGSSLARHVPRGAGARRERRDDRAHDRQRVRVVVGQVVHDARRARVDQSPAQVLVGHDLAGRGLHERRSAEEDRPLVAHDDRSRRTSPGRTRRRRCTNRARPRSGRCPSNSSAPGCRRSDRSDRGRGRPRPDGVGRPRRSRRGRGTAGGSPAPPPGRAGASSRSSGSTCRPSPSRRWRR